MLHMNVVLSVSYAKNKVTPKWLHCWRIVAHGVSGHHRAQWHFHLFHILCCIYNYLKLTPFASCGGVRSCVVQVQTGERSERIQAWNSVERSHTWLSSQWGGGGRGRGGGGERRRRWMFKFLVYQWLSAKGIPFSFIWYLWMSPTESVSLGSQNTGNSSQNFFIKSSINGKNRFSMLLKRVLFLEDDTSVCRTHRVRHGKLFCAQWMRDQWIISDESVYHTALIVCLNCSSDQASRLFQKMFGTGGGSARWRPLLKSRCPLVTSESI